MLSLLLAGTVLFCGCTSLSLFKNKRKARRSGVLQYAHPRYPGLVPQKPKPKSWLDPWGDSEEPKKAKSVPEWMKESKRIPFGEAN